MSRRKIWTYFPCLNIYIFPINTCQHRKHLNSCKEMLNMNAQYYKKTPTQPQKIKQNPTNQPTPPNNQKNPKEIRTLQKSVCTRSKKAWQFSICLKSRCLWNCMRTASAQSITCPKYCSQPSVICISETFRVRDHTLKSYLNHLCARYPALITLLSKSRQ